MSWGLMGSNQGPSGIGANDMPNQPHATEYTLQEWHRHERDRNAWEIEKQEMKGRIASLEGSARRADATQKALKKYVSILEKKVKDQAIQIKTGAASTETATTATTEEEREQFAAKILEKLRGNPPSYPVDDENQRSDLRSFLDNCQAEFNYLMISPANPMPPRESPPLPLMEDLRDDDYNMSMAQQQQQQIDQLSRQMPAGNYRQQGHGQANHVGQQQQPQHQQHPVQQHQQQFPTARSSEYQPTPMSRSGGDGTPGNAYEGGTPVDWAGAQTANPTANHAQSNDRYNAASQGDTRGGASLIEKVEKPSDPAASSADAWDFNEGPTSFPESSQAQQASHRPDTDAFPAADSIPKSPGRQPGSHRRKGSMSRRRSSDQEAAVNALAQKAESGSFKLRFGLRGHLDTVRTVIFSGGGSPGEPEICTAGDDGLVKRFHIPRTNYSGSGSLGPASDLDVQADFTHRGHQGAVLCLASWFAAPNFSTGGRATGDGWIFSGGQDTFIRVWERGRVDPKATIEGHTDAVWALCVLPATVGSVFGQSSSHGPPERIILVSGAADGTVKVWAVSAPPQMTTSPQPAADGSSAPGNVGAVSIGRRGGAGGGRVRGNSMSSGSAFASTPQPSVASSNPFHHTLIHTITRANSKASPTCITSLDGSGGAFVVSYSDAAIVVYDTRTGEEIGSMASLETYDGTLATSVNSVVATTVLETPQGESEDGGGPTAGSGVEGVIISGHEDQFIRFFDANSGQCTYNMLAHPAAISSLSLSPDGRELVSAGHDASLRFWSLEKRACTQEMTSHRIMRGEGVCSVIWSQDGRWVVSGGGDGVVKVFAR